MKKIHCLGLLLFIGISSFASAADFQPYQGYLCCNAWPSKYGWISDINYRSNMTPGMFTVNTETSSQIPAGTKVEVIGFGRNRVNLSMNGKLLDLGNDYSRDISDQELAKRWIWTTDPQEKIAKASPKIQQAIKEGKLVVGMTPEEVLMSMGYPVTSENPDLDVNKTKFWRYWLSSFDEVSVIWEAGVLKDVNAHPTTLLKVLMK